MPCLYQLKQVRSKFYKESTYSRCRCTSDQTSLSELQACSIWTLTDQDTTNAELAQRRRGSIVFQKIAIEVIREGNSAKLRTDELDAGESTNDCKIELLIGKIKKLGKRVPVIGNRKLDNILVDLAGALTKGLKEMNEKKIDQIKKAVY